jgi:hypothetical protein
MRNKLNFMPGSTVYGRKKVTNRKLLVVHRFTAAARINGRMAESRRRQKNGRVFALMLR